MRISKEKRGEERLVHDDILVPLDDSTSTGVNHLQTPARNDLGISHNTAETIQLAQGAR